MTYNRLGQQTSITDQRGTVRSLYYDALGRLTNDCVSTVGSDTDDTVLQIATAYEVRGMVQNVTSLDNATPGSGTALNQTWSTYNTFGQLIEEQQEHSGTVTTGSVSVGYAYDTGASGSNEIRLNQLIYPNGRLIDYSYAAGMDSTLNRITAIVDDATSTTLASYDYLGLGTVVRITYPEPGVWLDLWGGTSGTFNGLDQFNRIIDQRWQNSITTTPTDIDRYQYGYDQNSNRLWKANVVGTAAVGNLDEGYTYDTLNRLTQMQRGTLSDGVIIGTPAIEQDWGLDPLGNWSTFATAASGSATLAQQRTANTVNEITAISETTGPAWVVPAYDPAGNTTTMPQVADPTQSFTAVYDAWNRMITISDTEGTVGTYSYDGRSRRNAKTTSSGTRHFYWTNAWQDLEERAGTATTMDTQYVWGIRYIDELVCRDDATPERLYACQDANFNLTAITGSTGAAAQRFLYDSYGGSSVFTAAWSGTTDAYAWTIRLTGQFYEFESWFYRYRNRLYHILFGRFTSADLAGYSDGLNLYQYVSSNPIATYDPLGLRTDRGTFTIAVNPSQLGGLASNVTVQFFPNAAVLTQCLCDEIRFVQLVEGTEVGFLDKSDPWRVDDGHTGTYFGKKPYYYYQNPWKPGGPYKYAESWDEPGWYPGTQWWNAESWPLVGVPISWYLADDEVTQQFETTAVCFRGTEAGQNYGSIFWGHDLYADSSFLWVSTGGFATRSRVRGRAGGVHWTVPPPENHQANGNIGATLRNVTPAVPTARFQTMAGPFIP